MTFEEFCGEWLSEEPCFKVRTSGSTGIPKEMMLPKDMARISAVRTNVFFGISGSSHLHSCVAADYIGGKMMAVRAIEAGCRLTWEAPSNYPLCGLAVSDSIDLLAVVASQMHFILDNLEKLPRLGAIIIGGSAIGVELQSRIMASRLNAWETYGMTETASHIALRKVGDEWFTPMAGVSVSTDSRGCLVIKDGGFAPVVTNDLADFGPEGGFRISGRIDDVIISGGKKINPREIEGEIAMFVKAPFMVGGVVDAKWGEAAVLVIEGNPDDFDVERLRLDIRDVLPGWKCPKKIMFVAELPRTPNGKIRRKLSAG